VQRPVSSLPIYNYYIFTLLSAGRMKKGEAGAPFFVQPSRASIDCDRDNYVGGLIRAAGPILLYLTYRAPCLLFMYLLEKDYQRVVQAFLQ
jgi:hypothetical protein